MRTVLYTEAAKECILQFQRTISVMEGRSISLIPVERERVQLTIERVIEATHVVLDVAIGDLKGDHRGKREVSDARKIAMYICMKYVFGITQEKVADAFNREDRSCVSYAITTCEDLMKIGDKGIMRKVTQILDYINFKYITQ